MRYYSSEEMIAKSQIDINMIPAYHTLLPRKEVEKLNRDYEIYLVSGSVKEDE
jgi:hypothetical protein